MNVTKPEKSAQATADVEGEIRDLVRAEELSQSKPPSEIGAEPRDKIVPLIQKIVAPSIAEFERLIAELQEARTYLRSESERISSNSAETSRTALPASRCSMSRRWINSMAPISTPRVG